PADPERMDGMIAGSDYRDAPRSLEEVEKEVFERSGGNEPAELEKAAETKPADTNTLGTAQRTTDNRTATDKT
ncbi:MAG: hypothetical protein ABSC51_12330, partial [Gaiellaceae bacterium]